MTQPQPEPLRAASHAKAEAARSRATAAIRTLVKNHQPITFASVAREARVSQHYLHSQPELSTKIRTLRAAPHTPTAEPQPAESSIIAVLRDRLTEQDALIHQLRQEKTELQAQIETLYGQLITKPAEHDPES